MRLARISGRRNRCSLSHERCEERLLLTISDHTFAIEQFSVDVEDPASYRMSDLDNDGDLDLVVQHASGISWFSDSEGNRVFELRQSIDRRVGHFEFVDLDSDADLDLVLGDVASGISWYKNDGHGSFEDPQQIFFIQNGTADFVVDDFDNDSDMDLLAPMQNGRIAHLENTNGDGIFSLKELIPVSQDGFVDALVADLNSDGSMDLVAVSSSGITGHQNQNGSFSNQAADTIAQIPGTHPALVDIDFDGDVDLMLKSFDPNEMEEILWFENNSEGDFEQQTIPKSQIGSTLEIFLPGDVDNDGDADIISYRKSDDGASHEIYFRENLGFGESFADDVLLKQDATLIGIRDGIGDAKTNIFLLGTDQRFVTMDYRMAGDVNGDGLFDSKDLVRVFQAGRYENRIPDDSTFSSGDWNGDGEFDSKDLVFVFQISEYESITHPHLFFGPSDVPDLQVKVLGPRRIAKFNSEKSRSIAELDTDFSDPTLDEVLKSVKAYRMAFVVLMMERSDPDRARLAEKAREIMANINHGTWPGFGRFEDRLPNWEGTVELHPWHSGSVLMNYSLAYDWLVGAGELNGIERQDAKFRLLRLAQIEHRIQSTPWEEFHHRTYSFRSANYVFRSTAGVGFVTELFPNHTGLIYDPYDRLAPEFQEEFNSKEVQKWVLDELFEEITTAPGFNPSGGQSLVEHYVTKEGVYVEGFTYQNDAFGVLIPWLVSHHRNTGVDYLSDKGVTDGRLLKAFTADFRVMLPNYERPLLGDAWYGKTYQWHGLISSYMEEPAQNHWHGDFTGTTHFGVSMSGYDDTARRALPNYRTEFLPDSGIAVFRDEPGRNATYMMLAAQHRPVYGHDQADQGSITLFAHDTHLVLEPGFGSSYAKSPDEKGRLYGGKWNWITSALGHSGVTVDSVYSVNNLPNIDLRREGIHPKVAHSFTEVPDPSTIENTLAADTIDYAEAHVIFTEKKAKLERAVVFPRHKYFILEDNVGGETTHEFGWQLQLGRTAVGKFEGTDGDYVWSTPNRHGDPVYLAITMLDDNRTVNVYDNAPTNFRGQRYPEDTWDHTYILAHQEAQKTKFVTVLDPYMDTEEKLEFETVVEGKAWKVVHSPESYDLILSQVDTDQMDVGEIVTDANFMVASIDVVDGQEQVVSFFARGGTRAFVGYDQFETFTFSDDELFLFEAPN